MENFVAQVHAYPIQGDGLPLTKEYINTLENTVLAYRDGVTLFEGCLLHLDVRDDIWISPAMVSDDDKDTYFNLLYVGVHPSDDVDICTVPVYLDLTHDVDLKLSNSQDGPLTRLREKLSGLERAVIIRPCSSGMPYYPNVASPQAYEQHVMQDKLDKLCGALNLMKMTAPDADSSSIDSLDTNPKVYSISGKNIFAYEMTLENDPWKYYNIFSARRLEDASKENLFVRIDSGCDIGQLYDDNGCDCREQLHSALESLHDAGDGLVVHIPAQDGRGYGAAVIDRIVGIERGDLPEHTIDGAHDGVSISDVLLGDRYDNRTYQGVGRILLGMGIKSVVLQTDNRLKKEGLAKSGITVSRRATNTTGANGSMQDVINKRTKTSNYLDDESQDG